MKLSIIIVNYNVRHFLEQALTSASAALEQIDGEIIVIDNASVDDSVSMVQKQFPQVQLIESPINLGFSKGNNVGIRKAKGEYILLLNPDTLVEPDCFIKCIDFMDSHPQAGALGVPMLDGSGRYLPESKRGLPTLWASFCKMSGLSSIFPHSFFFNSYYQGHLSEKETNKVEILSGAFLLTRKSILDSLGGLDEDYFMYGEDIDLSYRILKMGFSNYYFANTQIIHFKGESTSRGSLNYVKHFYSAMNIFSQKHFKGVRQFGMGIFITAIIWINAIFFFLKNVIVRYWIVLLDGIGFIVGLYFIKKFWSIWYYNTPYYFKSFTIQLNIIIYTIIWLLSFYLMGVYEKKYRPHQIVMAVLVGFLINLTLYAMLPEDWRSSRMILLFSLVWVFIYSLFGRMLLNKFRLREWVFHSDRKKNILFIGTDDEKEQAKILLERSNIQYNLVHHLLPQISLETPNFWKDIIQIYQVEEMIFCNQSVPVETMVSIMNLLQHEVEYKIMSQSGMGIIGSSSKNQRGTLYTLDFQYNLSQSVYKRQKRTFDILFALFLLVSFPLFIWFIKNKYQFGHNTLAVLVGKKTWVGYSEQEAIEFQLPLLKPSIFHLDCGIFQTEWQSNYIRNYAWNYSVWNDLAYCTRYFLKLDQS